MYEFCAISAGYAKPFSMKEHPDWSSGSIGAAQKLNHGDSDIAIKYISIPVGVCN
jgi:hypothetical protein